jgi:pimeloyl-ACP methyl ester carboxylesterase
MSSTPSFKPLKMQHFSTFTTGGLELRLATSGEGKPVFFQHGLCGAAAQPHEVFPHGHGFRLHTLECRGHGGSPLGPPEKLSIKTFAKDVAACLETNVKAPCVLGGISMGAAIALHLAVHRPDLVKALVLARPAWLINAAPKNMSPNAEVGALLKSNPPAEARRTFDASATADILARQAPDNLASLRSFFNRTPQADTAHLLTAIANDGPGVSADDVRKLTLPVLIIATAQDVIHPMAHADGLHELLPHARRATLTPKGVDKPRHVLEFQSTLLAFLESLH